MKADVYSIKGYSLKEMRNENERGVCRQIEKMIEKDEYKDMCFCGVCLEDIYGLTLNKLPPKYKHSRTLMLKKYKVSESDIQEAIQYAMDIVGKSPNHV